MPLVRLGMIALRDTGCTAFGVRLWPFSDATQCPLPRRCWEMSGHRGYEYTP